MRELNELFEKAIYVVKAQYDEKMSDMFTFGDYKLKGMFKTKYSEARTMLLDGVTNTVNVSIYGSDGVLRNYDFTEDEFIPLYRAVVQYVVSIEKKYQQLNAEIVQLQTELQPEIRLNEIIETRNFDNLN